VKRRSSTADDEADGRRPSEHPRAVRPISIDKRKILHHIAIIACLFFHLIKADNNIDGKIPLEFSVYIIHLPILWKTSRNSGRILDKDSWTRFARYCDWIVRFIRFHGAKKHPTHMGKTEIETFLSHLAPNGKLRRHHVLESGLQKAVKGAVDKTGITKRVSCHTFRHCFATHLLENGVNIRVVQEVMGHADVKTTEIYTHVMEKDISVVLSPLDMLK